MKQKYPWVGELEHEQCCDPNEIIRVKNLSLYYGKQKAFNDISLNINKGCISGIIGPSGCGKSSFLQCINRVIEFNTNIKIEGNIFVDGVSTLDNGISAINLRKKIGIVFQEPTPLPLSILSNIELPLKEHGFTDIAERSKQALLDVGLWDEVKDKLKTTANNLSGGQKQRLCLARTIAIEPEIILMDEPCSSLDPISTEKIEQLIGNLKGKYTIVIVTHNLAQARRVCDDIFAFWYSAENECGELIESGSCLDIFEHSKNPIIRDYVGGLRG